jgi:hypothetical protein
MTQEKSLKSQAIWLTLSAFFRLKIEVCNKKLFNVSKYSTVKGFLKVDLGKYNQNDRKTINILS